MNQDHSEETLQFETIQRNIKLKIFEFTKNLLISCQAISPFIFYFLYLIQSLQILWFSINPSLKFLSQPLLLNYLRIGLYHLNFEGSLRDNNDYLQIFLIVSTCLILIYVICGIISLKLAKNKKSNFQLSQPVKIINGITAIQIILFNTILTIPVFTISSITLYCNKESMYYLNSSVVCYQNSHILYCSMAAFNIFVILVSTFYYWFMFYTKNPFSTNYYALSNSLPRLAKFVIKITSPIYFLIDIQSQYQQVFIFLLLAMLVFNLVMLRLFSQNNFNQKNFLVQFFFENFILWITAMNIFNYYFTISQRSNLFFLVTIISSFVFAIGLQEIYRFFGQRFLLQNLTKTIKKSNMCKFLYILVRILFYRDNTFKTNPLTCLLQLSQSIDPHLKKNIQNIQTHNLNPTDSRKAIIRLMVNFVSKLKQQNNSSSIKFIWINLLFDNGKKIVAFQEIGEINKEKLSTAEQFMVYFFKSTHSIYESENQYYQNTDQSMSQIQKYLEFTETMTRFENQIEICTEINQQYWEQLCQEVPSMQKVQNLAYQSYQKMGSIQNLFKQIQIIFPQNTTSFLFYDKFLQDVGTNLKEKTRITKKINNMSQKNDLSQKNNQDNGKIKFKPNQNMCVMSVSTTQSNIGTVLMCNTEIKRFLGYNRLEMIGQKVTKIMPKVYSLIHDDFIRNYLPKADQLKLPVEKIVYAMRKDMKMVQTVLAVKIFPSLISDFQLIGFYQKKNLVQDNVKIMVNLQNFEIQGMTQGFLDLTQNSIKLDEANKEHLKLNQIFPELNLNKQFEQQQQIETMFKFSDCTDKLIQLDDQSDSKLNMKQQVTITFQSIRVYQKATIAILNIIKNGMDEISLNKSHDQQLLSIKGTDVIKVTNNYLDYRPQEYTYDKNVSYTMSGLESNQSGLNERKVEEFIENNSYLKQIKCIKIMFVIMIASLIGTNILLQLFMNKVFSTNFKILNELGLSENLTEKYGLIVFLDERVFQISDDQTLWTNSMKKYKNIASQFQEVAITLFEKANARISDNLNINQQTKYNFTVDSDKRAIKDETSYIDGLFQLVYLTQKLNLQLRQRFQSPLQQEIQFIKSFISQNCKQLLPSIGQDTTLKYSNIFQISMQNLIRDLYLIIIGKFVILFLVFIVIIIFNWKFNTFNTLTNSLYCMILKWDAFQLETRCQRFLVSVLENQFYQSKEIARQSQLLRVIPKTLITNISKIGYLKRFSQPNIPRRVSVISNRQLKPKTNTAIFQPQKDTLIDSFRSIGQKDLLEQSSNEKVQLKGQFSKKFKYCFSLFLLFVFASVDLIFFFQEKTMTEELKSNENQINNLGKYTKNTLYTLYYGYETLKNEGTSFKELFDKQLSEFYLKSNQVEDLLGKNKIYMRKLYIAIDYLHQLVKQGDKQKLKSKQFIFIEEQIINNIQKISLFRVERLREIHSKMTENSKIDMILKMISEIVISLLIFIFVYFYILNTTNTQIKKSVCMIKILPIWLIDKNTKMKEILMIHSDERRHSSVKTISARNRQVSNITQEF